MSEHQRAEEHEPVESEYALADVEHASADAEHAPTDAEQALAADVGEAADTDDSERAPIKIEHAPVEVGLQRSVRYGRIIMTTIGLGAVLGMIASLFFPVIEGADYELGQVVGLMAVVGGAIGLAVGALLSLLLGIVARRSRGAAIAVQTDVR